MKTATYRSLIEWVDVDLERQTIGIPADPFFCGGCLCAKGAESLPYIDVARYPMAWHEVVLYFMSWRARTPRIAQGHGIFWCLFFGEAERGLPGRLPAPVI